MEFFCGILAFASYQLFLGNWMSENADRARRSLGKQVNRPGPMSRRQKRDLAVAIGGGWLCALLFFYTFKYSFGRSFLVSTVLPVAFAFYFVGRATGAWVGRHGVEIREHGIMQPGAIYGRPVLRTTLVTWDQVVHCVWSDWDANWLMSWQLRACTLLLVRCKSGEKRFYALDEQVPDLTTALVKYVEVLIATGKIPRDELQRPSEPMEIDTQRKPNEIQESRWRYSLKTLLLFTVFVACTSAWFGIKYRQVVAENARASEERAIIDSIVARFKPTVSKYPDGYGLDFSASAKKPTDADMVSLGKLHRLQILDLTGALITDAGLVYLEGLTELRRLDLAGTQVTQQGIARLQKALPGTTIYGP